MVKAPKKGDREMTRLKDLCEEINASEAPRASLPKWAKRLRVFVDAFWEYRFPGIKKLAKRIQKPWYRFDGGRIVLTREGIKRIRR
jgi:hypothetical protein